MKGILMVSHGPMAQGMMESAHLFFGDDIPQLAALCLKSEDNPEEFHQHVQQKIKELDRGDGVILLADLLGGTPCNQSVTLLDEKVDLIAGMNLGLLLEILGLRMTETDIDINVLVKTGQEGLVNIKQLLSDASDD